MRRGLLLFLVSLVLYNLNLREISSADTVPTRLLPVAFVRDGRLDLEGVLREPPAGAGVFEYSVQYARGRPVSSYPIVGALLAVPVYVVPVRLFGVGSWAAINALSKLTAAVVAAGSVVLVYLALSRLIDAPRAMVIALVYAFGTSTWSVSSQGLWQHGPAQLFMGAAIYCILRGEEDGRFFDGAGVLTGLMAAARVSTVFVAMSLIAYVLYRDWKRGARSALLGAGAALPFAGYNLWYFGSLEGGYARINATHQAFHFVEGLWTTPMGEGLAGLLFSPSRGLLIYSPVLVFAMAGIAVSVLDRRVPLLQFLAVGYGVSVLVLSKYSVWWGGHSFGPRLLADFLPALVLFLVPAMRWVERLRPAAIAFACLFGISVLVQVVGVLYYPSPRTVEWNKTPQDVDAAHHRLWDWKDTQILRLLRNGPRPLGFTRID